MAVVTVPPAMDRLRPGYLRLSRRRWFGPVSIPSRVGANRLHPARSAYGSGSGSRIAGRLVTENSNGERTYAVIFAKGDEILSGLTEFAEREKLTAGYFTAIGALQSARFGWFDPVQKAYRNIQSNSRSSSFHSSVTSAW